MEYRSRIKTSVISGCGMLIRGVVKFSARNCPGINFRKVGNYVDDNIYCEEWVECMGVASGRGE